VKPSITVTGSGVRGLNGGIFLQLLSVLSSAEGDEEYEDEKDEDEEDGQEQARAP
jgi:hypothetical protein